MKPTPYTLKENGTGYYTVLKHGSIEAYAFSEDAALHAVWVSEGSVEGAFYICDGGKVFLR